MSKAYYEGVGYMCCMRCIAHFYDRVYLDLD